MQCRRMELSTRTSNIPVGFRGPYCVHILKSHHVGMLISVLATRLNHITYLFYPDHASPYPPLFGFRACWCH